MKNVELVSPSAEYSQQYFDLLEEYKSANEKPTFGLNFKNHNFEEILEEINNIRQGIQLPAWQIPRDIYWLVHEDNKRILGVINIRDLATEYFMKIGGNIGYGVRPSERGKGYATKMLSLALEKFRKKGCKRVLLTCQADNTASEKVILNNGGIYDGEIYEDGVKFLRYWIEL